MIKCPHCSKKISDTAKKCKYCGEWCIKNENEEETESEIVQSRKQSSSMEIDNKTKDKENNGNNKIIMWLGIIIIIIGIIIFVLLYFREDFNETKKQEERNIQPEVVVEPEVIVQPEVVVQPEIIGVMTITSAEPDEKQRKKITEGFEPLTVILDASKTEVNISGDEIIYFTWDFGDGEVKRNTQNGVVVHTYKYDYTKKNGIFQPEVTIKTRNGIEKNIKGPALKVKNGLIDE